MPDFNPQIIGYMAGFLTTVSFLPQAIKTIKSRNTEAISLWMYGLFVIGIIFWLAYGWAIKDNTLIIANIVTLLFASPILLLKIRHVLLAKATHVRSSAE